MEEVTLDQFELGQLIVALGPTQLGRLTPELRKKLQNVFEENRRDYQKAYNSSGVELLHGKRGDQLSREPLADE